MITHTVHFKSDLVDRRATRSSPYTAGRSYSYSSVHFTLANLYDVIYLLHITFFIQYSVEKVRYLDLILTNDNRTQAEISVTLNIDNVIKLKRLNRPS